MEFAKKEKGILRKLFGRIYELELAEETTLLAKDFEDWNKGKISVWEINERIHKFHNGASRRLYNKYDTNNISIIALTVCEGILNGKITPEELPPDLFDKIKSLQSFFEIE